MTLKCQTEVKLARPRVQNTLVQCPLSHHDIGSLVPRHRKLPLHTPPYGNLCCKIHVASTVYPSRFVIPHFPKTLVHPFQTTVSSWCHFTFSSLPLSPPLLDAPAPLLSPLCYHASPLLFLDLHVLLLVEDLSCFPHLRNHQPHPLDLWTHHLCPEKKSDINLIA